MARVSAKVETLNPPRSLPRFLALWLASYLAPVLVALMALALVSVTGIANSLARGQYSVLVIWLCMLPVGFACGQWMLLRCYLPNALPWTMAVFAAAMLGQVSATFVPEVSPKTIGTVPLFWIFKVLRSTVGGTTAADALTVLPTAVCFGAAWAIPPALVMPGPRSARIAWAIAQMLTGVTVVVMSKTLPDQLFLTLFSYPITSRIVWAAVYGLPAIFGWIILSLVGGAVMYCTLRRGSAVGNGQLYARFD